MCVFSLTDWLILRNAMNVNKDLIDFKTLVKSGFVGYAMPLQEDLLPNIWTNGPSISSKTLPFIVLDDLLKVSLKELILHLNNQSIMTPTIFKSILVNKDQQMSFKLFTTIVLVILDAIGLLTATVEDNTVTFALSETRTTQSNTVPPVVTTLKVLEDTYTIKDLFTIMSTFLNVEVPFPILVFDILDNSNTIIQVTDTYRCYKILLVDSVFTDIFTKIFSETFNSVTYNTYYRYSQCNQLSLSLEKSTTKCMPHNKMIPILAQISNGFCVNSQNDLIVDKIDIKIIGQDDESCNC